MHATRLKVELVNWKINLKKLCKISQNKTKNASNNYENIFFSSIHRSVKNSSLNKTI